ncbi:MAG: polysaccharide biosynthesis tyrosine autokinase [Candidatus Omnitrophica bacterium]|nr:polysaccharide biosynthesis tyrosine autokinase [Candidatus Omnitrophota bacterium]
MSGLEHSASDVIEVDFKDIFTKIFKHKQTIISIVAIFIVVAVIYSFTAMPIYRSVSRILVEGKPPKIVKVDGTVLPDYTDQANFFNSQIEILKSHAIADLVFSDLGGYETWKNRGKSAGSIKPLKDVERIDFLIKHVKVTPVRMTQVIEVSVEDPDPELAARIANSWVRAYLLFSSVDQLVQRRSELETDLNLQLKFLKEKHPVIVGLKNEIDTIDQKIDNERVRLQSADNTLSGSRPGSRDISNVKILDRGLVPFKPISPRKTLNLVIAFILGLISSFGFILLFESLDQTIKTNMDVEQILRTTCLVAVPRQAKDKDLQDFGAEYITAKGRHSTVAEAFRSLRTGIIFSSPDRQKKTILVTSASPSEGKSTVAMNLATVFAQADERTIIIDTDLRNPRLHSVFKISRGQGITDVLAYDKADLKAYIHGTEIPNLDFMACGEIPPNPSELLGSKKMEEFIARLSGMYDRIIFDTPPILAATDAVVLSTRVNATILVVSSGSTNRHAALRCMTALKGVHAHILGVVLNKVNAKDQANYYYLYGENATKKV